MAKIYNEEFKKQFVKEYIQDKRCPALKKVYGAAKSSLSGCVKKYREECWFLPPHTTASSVFSTKEIQEFHKKIAELEKENLFLNQYKTVFGVRWLFRKFQLSPNAYYNMYR